MKILFLLLLLAIPSYASLCNETIAVSGQAVYQVAPKVYAGIGRAQIRFDQYTATTNAFGYYSLRIPNCGSYVATAQAKGFIFESSSLTLPIPDAEDLYMTFVAVSKE